jgi:hypothetical protein
MRRQRFRSAAEGARERLQTKTTGGPDDPEGSCAARSETWVIWAVLDVAYVVLFASRELYLSAAL